MTTTSPTTTLPDPAQVERDAVLDRLTALGKERAALIDEMDDVTTELRDATVAAVEAGVLSQKRAADAAGVDRMRVRGWLGVRRRRSGAEPSL